MKIESELSALEEAECIATKERRRAEKAKARARKYHKVKFFERRKIERRLCQVRRELASEPTNELRKIEAALLEDLDYIKYFPKDRKYISLFFDDPNDKKSIRRRGKYRALALEAAAEARAQPNTIGPSSDDNVDNDSEEEEASQSAVTTLLPGKDSEKQQTDDFFFVPSSL
eukprot:CAMPEP_0197290128 /NCGR_PEP_ID=MMETSP0890-20130614/7380_1 /TAXON_ID=44058 ORGANISM="Aureoumbra lagunensis, Strain CCMP1510" /NCGR_SAMPLE_ID=MMETSP0890 /ASSEMBLY_ACC=CAM_ASM_000533 /LENGTH=171 /DNA_ID=CAMNT_0042761967 /DNA_START=203 /DNA_END=718 /DNA_ORIENTATION=-